MKKQIKSAAAIALAMSAITPVAAFAADAQAVAPGLYTSNSFTDFNSFKAKTPKEKGRALLDSSSVLVFPDGRTIKGSLIVSATNAELTAATYSTAAAYAAANNVEFSPTGVKAPGQNQGELKVESVSAINGTEVVVKFNGKVLSSSLANATFDFKTKSPAAPGTVNPTDVQVTADGKGAILQFAQGDLADLTSYTVEISDVVSESYVKLADYEGSITISADKVAPKLVDAKVSGTDLLVTFDEPVDFTTTPAVVRIDNTPVTGAITAPTDAGDYVYEIDLSADTFALTQGNHELTIVGLADIDGNEASTLKKSYTVGTDTVAPTVSSIKALGSDTFKVVFSEAVTDPTVVIKKGTTQFAATTVETSTGATGTSAKEWFVTVASTAGSNDLYASGESEINLSVEVTEFKDSVNLVGSKYTGSVTLGEDVTGPKLIHASNHAIVNNAGATEITLHLDEEATLSANPHNFVTVVDPDGVALTPAAAANVTLASGVNGTDTAVKITVAGAPKEGTYKVSLKPGLLKDKSANTNASLAITQDVKFTAAKTYAKLGNGKITVPTANTIQVVFPEAMDSKALDTKYYQLDNEALPTGSTIVFTDTAKTTVAIKLPSTFAVPATGDYKFEVSKELQAASGNYIVADDLVTPKTSHVEYIQLTDNVVPTLNAATFVLTAGSTETDKVKLTFSEAIAATGAVADTDDIYVEVNGKKIAATIAAATSGAEFEVTLAEKVNSLQAVTLTVVPEGSTNPANTATVLKDAAGNKVKATTVTIKK